MRVGMRAYACSVHARVCARTGTHVRAHHDDQVHGGDPSKHERELHIRHCDDLRASACVFGRARIQAQARVCAHVRVDDVRARACVCVSW